MRRRVAEGLRRVDSGIWIVSCKKFPLAFVFRGLFTDYFRCAGIAQTTIEEDDEEEEDEE